MTYLQQPIQEIETVPEVSPADTVIETTESHNSSIEEVEIDFVAKIKKILFTLWRKIIEIRNRNLNEENVPQSLREDQIEQIRLYHVWPGKNVRMLLLFGKAFVHSN